MYLKEFREKIGMTQNQLSESLGIAQTTIARYEKDKVKPTSTVILKYINKLNANPLYLFNGIEPIFLDEQNNINKEYLIKEKIKKMKEIELEIEELKK
jgi:transcriptional regulator with XRE-family HTH domain